jgi:hypothetical protein
MIVGKRRIRLQGMIDGTFFVELRRGPKWIVIGKLTPAAERRPLMLDITVPKSWTALHLKSGTTGEAKNRRAALMLVLQAETDSNRKTKP